MASRTSTAYESRAIDLVIPDAVPDRLDIMVDFTRGNAGAADYLDSLGDDYLLLTITTLELIAGARNQREVADLDIMILAYEQAPPTDNIARRAYYTDATAEPGSEIGAEPESRKQAPPPRWTKASGSRPEIASTSR
jgi:hypothetical protein